MKVTQWCPTIQHVTTWPRGLCSPVHGILQARILEGDFPLQGIFPTQGSNPGLPHWRRILYQLSHQESPKGREKRLQPGALRSLCTLSISTPGGKPEEGRWHPAVGCEHRATLAWAESVSGAERGWEPGHSWKVGRHALPSSWRWTSHRGPEATQELSKLPSKMSPV